MDDKLTEVNEMTMKNSITTNSAPSIPASSKKANSNIMKGKDLVNPNKKRICSKGAKF
jgi:hypothetical protein